MKLNLIPKNKSACVGTVVIVAIVIYLIVRSFPLPAGNKLTDIQRLQALSEHQLWVIKDAILEYKNNYGKLPRDLYDLITDKSFNYNDSDFLKICYAPNKAQSLRPSGWKTDKELLKSNADYIIPSSLNKGVLVYEKPGLWPDGTVAVCFNNLIIKRLSSNEFTDLGLNK